MPIRRVVADDADGQVGLIWAGVRSAAMTVAWRYLGPLDLASARHAGPRIEAVDPMQLISQGGGWSGSRVDGCTALRGWQAFELRDRPEAVELHGEGWACAIDLRGVSLEADPWRYRVVEQCGETLEVVEVVCGRAFGPPPLPFSVVGLDSAPFDSPSGSLRSIAGEFWEGLDVVTFAYADDVQPRPNVIERWLDSRVEFGTVLAGSNNLLTVGFPTTT